MPQNSQLAIRLWLKTLKWYKWLQLKLSLGTYKKREIESLLLFHMNPIGVSLFKKFILGSFFKKKTSVEIFPEHVHHQKKSRLFQEK